MAAITGEREPDGLDNLSEYNRGVVTSLRGTGTPGQAHPEMAAVVWMFAVAAAALTCALLTCGPALWAWLSVGGAG